MDGVTVLCIIPPPSDLPHFTIQVNCASDELTCAPFRPSWLTIDDYDGLFAFDGLGNF